MIHIIATALKTANPTKWQFVLQLNVEENNDELDSDSDHFLMSSLSEAQLMEAKNESKVSLYGAQLLPSPLKCAAIII
jgi:hypothetical protein